MEYTKDDLPLFLPSRAQERAKLQRVRGIVAVRVTRLAPSPFSGKPLPIPGTQIGMLYRDQRILATVLTTDDPPQTFAVAYRVSGKRKVTTFHADDCPFWWWWPLAGDEAETAVRHRSARRERKARAPRLPLFEGPAPLPPKPRRRRTAAEIAQSRAKAAETRKRNRIAAARKAIADEVAATDAKVEARARWKAEHPAPTRAELEALRGMFPNVHAKHRR